MTGEATMIVAGTKPPTTSRAHTSSLRNEFKFILIVVSAGILVVAPILFWGIPSGGDLPNHFRFAIPFYESITSGHFYPGWLAESNYGFGDARFRFYPPGLYYVFAAFKFATGWFNASVLSFALLSALGGLGTYFWARNLFSKKVAMWAGVIYTIAPYHLNELYQASLLSEYAACSVLPFLFAFVERVCRRGRIIDVAGLAASYALLVLTHLPLTVIGSLTLLVYAAVLLDRKRIWSTVLKLSAGGLLGLAASSFFWVTMLAELSWIKGNSANQNLYYDYRGNFLFSPSALSNRNTWYANLLALAVCGLLAPAIILIKRKTESSIITLGVVTLFSLLMATEISRPLWLIIPKLREVQFPWRWLAITSLFGSILLAASLPKWIERCRKRFRPLYFAPALCVVLSLGFVATQVVWDSDFLPRAEFQTLLTNIRGSASFQDWMPKWVDGDVKTFAPSQPVTVADRKVEIVAWDGEHREFNVSSGTTNEARIRTFYYPLWKARAGSQELSVKPDAAGAMLVTLPTEPVNVTLNFTEPMRVSYAGIASGLGWLVILSLYLFQFFRRGMKHNSASVSLAQTASSL